MADPPPPVAQPDELSPLDYLMHRGESHPATRSAFLNLEILDRSADWGGFERRSTGPDGWSSGCGRRWWSRRSRPRRRGGWSIPTSTWTTTCAWSRCPPPGTLRQLLDLAEVTLQSPLDTSRALWEAVYVEGLEGGRSALLTKLSHAITHGLGGIALFSRSTTPNATRSPALCRRYWCRAT